MAKSAKEVFGDIHFIFKVVEFLCCLAGVLTMYIAQPIFLSRLRWDCVVVALYAYMYVTCAFIIVYIFEETLKLLELLLLFVGAVYGIVAGILAIIEFDQTAAGLDEIRSALMFIAIFAIAAGVVMLVDFIIHLAKK